jgi:hypothetical protein
MATVRTGAGANTDEISRRRVLRDGVLLFSGGYIAASRYWPAAAAVRKKAVFKLDHKADGEWCKACKRHANNKLFATRTAVRRAHRHCNCQVVKLFIKRSKWKDLFGPPSDPIRTSVDKRWAWVRRILYG